MPSPALLNAEPPECGAPVAAGPFSEFDHPTFGSAPAALRRAWAWYPLLGLSFGVWLAGCGEVRHPDRKPTTRVYGVLTVDGAPPSDPVQILCHLRSPADPSHTTVSAAQTGPEGRFEFSTYESGDGVPAGDYALTFEWRQLNALSMTYSGPDKLNQRYQNADRSATRFTVREGDTAPIDLGTIALTTQ